MLANGVKETTATTGTGALTLASVSGFVRFSQKHSIGDDSLFPYTIVDSTGAPLEGGTGYLSGTSVMVRAKVLWTYSAGVYNDLNPTALSLTGTNTVLCSQPWQATRSAGRFGGQYTHVNTAYKLVANAATATDANGANAWSNIDRVHYWPILLEEGAIVDGFVVSGCVNSVAASAAFGLHTIKADGTPGKRLASSGIVVPANSTASQAFSFVGASVPVMAGVYMMSAIITNTALTFDKELSNPLVFGSQRSRSLPMQVLYETVASGWTDVPATPGTMVPVYITTITHPCVSLRVP